MLIHPEGILKGNRIGRCSDDAQLHFPRILAASNTCGRFRMSLEWLQNEVYGGFTLKPTKEQLTKWLREYYCNFLLFVYKAEDGSTWAQWDVPKKMQSRHPLAADRRTPEPPTAEFEAFRYAYREMLRLENSKCKDDLGEHFRDSAKAFAGLRKPAETPAHPQESARGIGIGVGVGLGGGIGVGSSPAAPELLTPEKQSDPRHIPFRDAVHEHWRQTVPGMDVAPWNGSEAKALDNLLRANPNLTLDQFATCLRHRAESRVQPSDRPRRYLETITDYLSGPKDEFGKPLHANRPRDPVRATLSPQDEAEREAAARRQREEDLELWRDLRQRGSPLYARVPEWVRTELEGVQ